MKTLLSRYVVLIPLLAGATVHRAAAQEVREPEGGALPAYARVGTPWDGQNAPTRVDLVDNGLPNIMITGYWPPTNEMVRQFSNSPEQNPDGWVGENWEGRGYNIYAFFPEFPDGVGKGEGDFEVDYQDTSYDWWRIIDEVQPVALTTFSRADFDFDWEMEGGNRTYDSTFWIYDYLEPYQPTPDLPIYYEPHYYTRRSSLPMEEIVDAVNAEVSALYAYIEPLDDSRFLSNFIGYHGNWYFDLHASPVDPLWTVAAGHIHVGYAMLLSDAIQATEVTLRVLLEHVDARRVEPFDFDFDGDQDLADFALFSTCLSGPGDSAPPAGCTQAQFDQADYADDHDVDMDDFLVFHGAFTEH